MQANQLSQEANKFTKHLNSIEGTRPVVCEHRVAPDAFINIYKNDLPDGSGVYWFYLPNGNVFYIGETKTDNFAKRIWTHAKTTPKILGADALGFPDCEFCAPSRLSEDEREDIRRGQFRIDYLIVSPRELAPVFEVYLQGVYFLRESALPACNRQFG